MVTCRLAGWELPWNTRQADNQPCHGSSSTTTQGGHITKSVDSAPQGSPCPSADSRGLRWDGSSEQSRPANRPPQDASRSPGWTATLAIRANAGRATPLARNRQQARQGASDPHRPGEATHSATDDHARRGRTRPRQAHRPQGGLAYTHGNTDQIGSTPSITLSPLLTAPPIMCQGAERTDATQDLAGLAAQ